MFDIGFWELAVIGVIALLVVGPERLPGVARNVGLWVGRIRRYVAHVKQDIERELHAEEVRQLLEKPEGLDDLKDVARETASVFDDASRQIGEVARDAGASGDTRDAGVPDTARETRDGDAGGGTRAVPHHAVDEDPFAEASIARVSPHDDSNDKAQAGASDPAPGDSDEHRSGRQGQR